MNKFEEQSQKLADLAKRQGDPQAVEVADQMFRERMQASDQPEAKRWVELDQQAQKGEKELNADQSALQQRKDQGLSLHEVEQNLNQARNGRDALMSQGRPSVFQREEREAYDQKLGKWNEEIASNQKAFGEMVKQSSPEEIQKLQTVMEQRQQEVGKLVDERQGIAKLPSEQLSMREQIQQSREAWAPEFDREGRFQGNGQGLSQTQEQSDRQSDGTAMGRKIEPRWDKAFVTPDDMKQAQQIQDDQTAFKQQNGRAGTDQEMQAFAKEREAREAQQGQGQSQAQAQPQQQEQSSFQQQLAQRRSQQQ